MQSAPLLRRPAGTAFVLLTVLLDALGVGLLNPVGPRLVASFVNGDLAVASRYFGLLVSLYAVMQFVFAPIVGGLSDRFGRRPIILVSLAGGAASYLLSGFAPSLRWLFLGRTISGVTGASYSAAGAYIADVTPPEKRAQSFGLIGAAFGLGFILGPALGGLLGNVGVRIPYFAAAGLNLLNLGYGLFVLPESLTKSHRRSFEWKRANPFGTLAVLGGNRLVLGLATVLTCSLSAQWLIQSTWALIGQARFGWSVREVGGSLMIVGLATALVQGALVRPVVARLGERRTAVLGLAISVAGQTVGAFVDRGWVMLLFMIPFALGGIAGPPVQALISREIGATRQGELHGALNSLQAVAAICGPIIGTALFSRFSAAGSIPYVPGAPFLAMGLFNGIALALAVRSLRRARPTPG